MHYVCAAVPWQGLQCSPPLTLSAPLPLGRPRCACALNAPARCAAADNYDGPDMTYYFDQKDKPPSGPDDAPGPSNRAYWAARASRAKANPNAKRVGDDGLPMHAASKRGPASTLMLAGAT
jgi:hypothetical protein